MAKLKPNQFYLGGRLITERPILFQTDMVKAILGNRKTQTRRKCRHQHWSHSELTDVNKNGITQKIHRYVSCPYGQPGDLLWVRESFYEPMFENLNGKYYYKADLVDQGWHFKWKPSIHMPKSAARLWQMVEDIRVERLQDISEKNAIAEGIKNEVLPIVNERIYYFYPCNDLRDDTYLNSPITSFYSLWKSINGQASWDANPWVWVVQYRVLSKTGRPNDQTILTNHLQITGKEVTHV